MDADHESAAGKKPLADTRKDLLLQCGIKVGECQIPAENEMEPVFGRGLPDVLHEKGDPASLFIPYAVKFPFRENARDDHSAGRPAKLPDL